MCGIGEGDSWSRFPRWKSFDEQRASWRRWNTSVDFLECQGHRDPEFTIFMETGLDDKHGRFQPAVRLLGGIPAAPCGPSSVSDTSGGLGPGRLSSSNDHQFLLSGPRSPQAAPR